MAPKSSHNVEILSMLLIYLFISVCFAKEKSAKN